MKYFKNSNYAHSDTAVAMGIFNKPTRYQYEKFEMMVFWLLDPLSEHLGKPVYISSGFRSKKLNKAIKGSRNSQHKAYGCVIACDIVTDDLKAAFEWLKDKDFDQLILEESGDKNWIHISMRLDDKNRHQIMTYKNGKYEVQKHV